MGPLQGLTIIEIAGHRPGPFCRHAAGRHGGGCHSRRASRVAALFGTASRPAAGRPEPGQALYRRQPERSGGCGDGAGTAAPKADALLEGNRPGVMERLGLGPETCLERNPRPGLRPHDRLGTGRSAGPGCRARHQLHSALGRPARHGKSRRKTRHPTQPGGRLRWRRPAAGIRYGVRPAGSQALR